MKARRRKARKIATPSDPPYVHVMIPPTAGSRVRKGGGSNRHHQPQDDYARLKERALMRDNRLVSTDEVLGSGIGAFVRMWGRVPQHDDSPDLRFPLPWNKAGRA